MAFSNTLIGAAQPVITRYGVVHLDPLLFCTCAVTIATVCTGVLLYLRGEFKVLIDPRYRNRLIMMSMSGTAMTGLTLTYGLTRIGAVAGVLLLQTEPIYSLILSTIFVGERPSIRQLLATATILIGIGSVFAAGSAFTPAWAAVLVFLTPLFWQASHVMGLKVMPPLTPLQISGARFLYTAIVFIPALLIFRADSIAQLADPRLIGAVGLTGFFVYFLSAITWYGAINRLSLTWTTSLVVPGVPLISILLAVIFLGERTTAREIIGIAIAVSGVVALVLGADAHRAHPDAEAAEAIHEPMA